MFTHPKVFEDNIFIKFPGYTNFRRIKNWTPTFKYNGLRYIFRFIFYIHKENRDKILLKIKGTISHINSIDSIISTLTIPNDDKFNLMLHSMASNMEIKEGTGKLLIYNHKEDRKDPNDENKKYCIYIWTSSREL